MMKRSIQRQAVLDAVERISSPVGPGTIAAMTGQRAARVGRLLGKLVKEGAIIKVDYGRYATPSIAQEFRRLTLTELRDMRFEPPLERRKFERWSDFQRRKARLALSRPPLIP
jgi:hypothetical protein